MQPHPGQTSTGVSGVRMTELLGVGYRVQELELGTDFE